MAEYSAREIFESFDLNSRMAVLGERGEQLCSVDRYKHRVYLYLVEDFYAEVYFRPVERIVFRVERSTAKSLRKFLPLIALPNLNDL